MNYTKREAIHRWSESFYRSNDNLGMARSAVGSTGRKFDKDGKTISNRDKTRAVKVRSFEILVNIIVRSVLSVEKYIIFKRIVVCIIPGHWMAREILVFLHF